MAINVELGDVVSPRRLAMRGSRQSGSPDTAAVDRASVSIEPRQFPGEAGTPRVLILRARLAASDGTVHAISYQVTVLANPLPLDNVMTLNPGATPPWR